MYYYKEKINVVWIWIWIYSFGLFQIAFWITILALVELASKLTRGTPMAQWGTPIAQWGCWCDEITQAQDALAIFQKQKIIFRSNKDFMKLYHRVHDLSHTSQYFVREFVRCSVITCYNSAWGNCELECYNNVIRLHLTNSPSKYLPLWLKSCGCLDVKIWCNEFKKDGIFLKVDIDAAQTQLHVFWLLDFSSSKNFKTG